MYFFCIYGDLCEVFWGVDVCGFILIVYVSVCVFIVFIDVYVIECVL